VGRSRGVEQASAEEKLKDRASACRYFTDGANLYRLVGWLSRSLEDKLAELEDCRSLDILLIPARELNCGRLQPVR
jgi:hypothetical protein